MDNSSASFLGLDLVELFLDFFQVRLDFLTLGLLLLVLVGHCVQLGVQIFC